jgi:hypothetical protein
MPANFGNSLDARYGQTQTRAQTPRHREDSMALQLLGKDPESPNGGSPTFWLDTDTGDILAQGYTDITPGTLAEIGDIPTGEAIIRFPERMIRFLPVVLK